MIEGMIRDKGNFIENGLLVEDLNGYIRRLVVLVRMVLEWRVKLNRIMHDFEQLSGD